MTNDLIVKLARDICEFEGHDPDRQVLMVKPPMIGARGYTMLSSTMTQYELYYELAEFLVRNYNVSEIEK